jgi:dTDP-4-dehydrorhamnose reductase
MPVRIAVIGALGQLGQDIVSGSNKANLEIIPLTHRDIEVTNISSVNKALVSIRPNVVINTAAFHNVSMCESSPEMAYSVNTVGASNVAVVSAALGAKNVFISTDYVFAGDIPNGQYNKLTTPPAPVNVYGNTKLAGEEAVRDISSENLIFRISSVFGTAGSSGKGGNFIEAIIRKVSLGEIADVVDDSLMSPTYTVTASKILLQLLQNDVSGIQHGSSAGQCSWFELASFAASKIGKEDLVRPICSPVNQVPARPVNSSLDTTPLGDIGVKNIDWQESVTRYLEEKGHLV